jgi:hypothetical protein
VSSSGFDWARSGFVWVYGNVPLVDVLPPWLSRLFVQVASGTAPSAQVPPPEWLERARAAGFELAAWAWCVGLDVETEAAYHAEAARAIGASVFVANMEAFYDAGGDSSSPKFGMPGRYLDALDWAGPLGVTTTPLFGSHMGDWQQAGAVYMPQSFPLAAEGGYDLPTVVAHGEAWGWERAQIRPLVQTYEGPTGRPDANVQNAQASELGVGVCPYTVEQGYMTPAFEQLRASIERPTTPVPPVPPDPDNGGGGEVAYKIGPQHGITARLNKERKDDPAGTARGPGWRESDESTWPLVEREWRREMMEWANNDGVKLDEPVVPPAP